MKYQCIQCKTTWGQPDENETEGFSHGLCKKCAKIAMKPSVTKKQRAEGNFDCFGSSNGFCDQEKCKYREVCL